MLAVEADREAQQDSQGDGEDARCPIKQRENGIQPASKGGMDGGTVARQKKQSDGAEYRPMQNRRCATWVAIAGRCWNW